MKTTVRIITGAALAALAITFASARDAVTVEKAKVKESGTKAKKKKNAPDDTPIIQLALLLDTSNSMDGLIEQAKTQLWSVVNEFITAKQNGKTPYVQVALYEYGKSSLSKEQHYIRRTQPLTRDLDKISEELFALKTNGGDEYCGAVITRATQDLKWDPSSKIYKAIFIAGNEPFTQGPIEPKQACKDAITKGIIVNTIHCGAEQAGINGGWKNGAMLADGSFMIIDQNQAVAHVDAPQDKEIVKLNEALNRTYIVYGKEGKRYKDNQIAQDNNANGIARSNLAGRAATKASANYWNPNWDVVDWSNQKNFKWEDVKKEDLPKDLQKLSTEELKAHVAKKEAERGEVQTKILKLTKERAEYVAEKRKEMAKEAGKSLGDAVASAVRKQAATKGVTFGTSN